MEMFLIDAFSLFIPLLLSILMRVASAADGETSALSSTSNFTISGTYGDLGGALGVTIEGCSVWKSASTNPLVSDCTDAILQIPITTNAVSARPGMNQQFSSGKCQVEVRLFGAQDTFTWLSMRLAAADLAFGCQRTRDDDWSEPRTVGALTGLGALGNIKMRIGKPGKMPGGWPELHGVVDEVFNETLSAASLAKSTFASS